MKKMLIAALCLLTLSGSAMAAQNVPKELQMSGTVTENTGSMITVKNSNKPFDGKNKNGAKHGRTSQPPAPQSRRWTGEPPKKRGKR